MKTISAAQLATQHFDGLNVSEPFNTLFGRIEQKAYALIWGPPGQGKSTFTLDLANDLARNGVTVYVAAEEGLSLTMQDKIQRLQAVHPNLFIAEYDGLASLKTFLVKKNADFVILDSISEVDPRSSYVSEFKRWCKEHEIGLFIVAHAQKTGKNYKGTSDVGHGTDIVVKVDNGIAKTTKNRYKALAEINIRFGNDKHKRENPVPVPFTVTLAEIAKAHPIKGIKRLNDLVDFKFSCTVDRSPVSFRYRRENKKSYLEMLKAGTVIHTHGGDDFLSAWKKMVDETGQTVIEIDDQVHAKLVLGAKEYRRQEKAAKGEKVEKAPKKAPKPKPVKDETLDVPEDDIMNGFVASDEPDHPSKKPLGPKMKRKSRRSIHKRARTKVESKAKTEPKAPKKSRKKAATVTPITPDNGVAFDKGMDNIEALLQKALKN